MFLLAFAPLVLLAGIALFAFTMISEGQGAKELSGAKVIKDDCPACQAEMALIA
jgi:hypothetical protein